MSVAEAVEAIREGDVARLELLLQADPSLVNETLPGNPRSLLHHATDWPGHRPSVSTTIALLVASGADPSVGFPSSEPMVSETPLHWAVSANDVDAATALLAAGADVDALGGIFGGCTPYEEAIIFEQYEAARLLLEHGASNYLPGAAALGHTDAIDDYFDADGLVDVEANMLPNWITPPPAQVVLDRAFQFACRAGHLTTATMLLARGADPHSKTPTNTTAADEARDNGHEHVVRWLQEMT
jgi:hypothetical protein